MDLPEREPGTSLVATTFMKILIILATFLLFFASAHAARCKKPLEDALHSQPEKVQLTVEEINRLAELTEKVPVTRNYLILLLIGENIQSARFSVISKPGKVESLLESLGNEAVIADLLNNRLVVNVNSGQAHRFAKLISSSKTVESVAIEDFTDP